MICKACKSAPATRVFHQDRQLWTTSRRARSRGRVMAWCEACWATNVAECEASRLRGMAELGGTK
jgi:hypothetical protein